MIDGFHFFKLKERDDIDIKSFKDGIDLEIGTIRGSQETERLLSEGFTRIQEVSTDIQNLNKLKLNRIDLIAQEELVLVHSIELYNQRAPSDKQLHLEDFQKVLLLPPDYDEKGLYIAMSISTHDELVSYLRNNFESLELRGSIIEVAHWWTNDVEQEMLQVYKKALKDEGYLWIDYMFEGGAGTNMKKLLEIREEVQNMPHAIQTYMGPALWEWADKDALINLDEVAVSEHWSENLPPLINEMIQYQDHYYGVPVNMQRVNWLWLNPLVFKDSGALIPETLDELFSSLDLIKDAGYIPLALGGEPWQECTLFENIVLAVGGADFYRKAFIDLDPESLKSSTMSKALEKFRNMRNYIDKDSPGRSWTDTAGLVADGKAAVMIMGDWVKAVFESRGLGYGETGYLSIPTPGTAGIFLNNTDVFAFPKGKKSELTAQETLARIIMDRDVQENFNLLKGSIPARTNIPFEKYDEVSLLSMESVSKDLIIPSFNFRQTAPEQIHDAIVDFISMYFHSDMNSGEAAFHLSALVEELSGDI